MSKRPSDADQSGPNKAARQGEHTAAVEDDAKPAVLANGSQKPKSEESLPLLHYKQADTLRGLANHRTADGQWQRVEVRIPANSMTSSNPQVRARQLWGADVYTEDSDLVAVLMHTGHYTVSMHHAPPSLTEVRAVVLPMPPQQHYTSCSRNSIRSRAWGAKREGCSYKVERCWAVSTAGTVVDLAPSLEGVPPAPATFTPAANDRTHTTRATAVADRRMRPMQEVTMQYNLCNEPWLKFSIGTIADRGLKANVWTGARLSSDVLYVETHRHRFELSKVLPTDTAEEDRVGDSAAPAPTPPVKEEDPASDKEFRWARCRRALPQSRLRALGVPLPRDELEDVVTGLRWEDIKWANSGVLVQGRFYALARLYFAARNPEEPETMESPQPPPSLLPPPMANGSALNEVLEAAAAANAIVM